MMSKTTKTLFILPLIFAIAGCEGFNRNKNADGMGGAGDGGMVNRPVDTSQLDAPNPASSAYFRSRVGDRVLFAVDQSELSSHARATLDAQAGWLLANPEFQARIEGHADEQGTREHNLALGARRAESVREYLQSRGVAASRMTTVSYGKERPIEVCSTEECYSKNRRAVTVVAGGLTS